MNFFKALNESLNRALNYKQWRDQKRAEGTYREPVVAVSPAKQWPNCRCRTQCEDC